MRASSGVIYRRRCARFGAARRGDDLCAFGQKTHQWRGQRVGSPAAKQGGGEIIEHHDVVIAVHRDDGVHGGVDDRGQLRLAGIQGQLGLLVGGHIMAHAAVALKFARRAVHGLAAEQQVAHAPARVGLADAEVLKRRVLREQRAVGLPALTVTVGAGLVPAGQAHGFFAGRVVAQRCGHHMHQTVDAVGFPVPAGRQARDGIKAVISVRLVWSGCESR
jgi:hypothetical protein